MQISLATEFFLEPYRTGISVRAAGGLWQICAYQLFSQGGERISTKVFEARIYAIYRFRKSNFPHFRKLTPNSAASSECASKVRRSR